MLKFINKRPNSGLLMSTARNQYDLATNKDFMKNIKNLLRYSQKNSKIVYFSYTMPPIMVTLETSRADKVSKIVLKVVKEDFGYTCKKLCLLLLSFFHASPLDAIKH